MNHYPHHIGDFNSATARERAEAVLGCKLGVRSDGPGVGGWS